MLSPSSLPSSMPSSRHKLMASGSEIGNMTAMVPLRGHAAMQALGVGGARAGTRYQQPPRDCTGGCGGGG